MLLVEPVKAVIHQCFNFYNYSDAAFLSERLYAEVPSSEALHLLASSYYLMGKPWKAYMVLSDKKNLSSDCRYLFAKCCLELNKLNEAESTLMKQMDFKKGIADMREEFGEVACFAFNILGQVCSNTERKDQAIYCFKESLKLNPFLWSSFKMLCELGDTTDPIDLMQVNTENLSSVCKNPFPAISFIHSVSSLKKPSSTHNDPVVKELFSSFLLNEQQDLEDMARSAAHRRVCELKDNSSAVLSPLNHISGLAPLVYTPSINSDPSLDTSLPNDSVSPIINTSASKTNQPTQTSIRLQNVFSQCGNNNFPKESTANKEYNNGLRRSTRLFNHTNSSVKENAKSQLTENRPLNTSMGRCRRTRSKLAWTPLQDNEKKPLLITSTVNNKSASTTMLPNVRNCSNSQKEQKRELEGAIEIQRQSANGLIKLLQQIAKAYQALSQYNCSQAITQFKQLPFQHYNTAWVLCQVGKAYFELSDYKNAETVFSEARRLEPHRMEGMEVYSTVLWHLQQEVDLSALAQELTTIDKLSPQAWCATGNCFSLQKEHDTAIRFFQRAIQVEPSFTYAYTLLGHEYALIEELDKAMTAFQNAIRINERHYNAWYGLGMVHYKQEKFSLACLYFSKALAINGHSSALLCHLGVVQHAQKDSRGALDTLDVALHIEPRNPLCKFHKASVLFANDRPREALKELDELKQIVPKESLVYFLIGRIHRKLGNTHLALINFSWAMDLDPKGTNNHIKETINKRYAVDDDDPANDQSIEGPSHNETNDETANQSTSLINETAATNKSEEVLIIDEEDEGGEEVFSDLFLMNVGY